MKWLIALVLIIFISGCSQKEEKAADNQTAVNACVEACQTKLKSYLVDGPCLSNNIAEGWVCDIAHNPRQSVDEKPENQCSDYTQGNKRHFVELDLECKLIKAY